MPEVAFMKVEIAKEEGEIPALYGLGFSFRVTSDITYTQFENSNSDIEHMRKVAATLAHMDDGHNKFLESMVIWAQVRAPRYWWQEMDTYRVGVTKQSESTMHTLMKTGVNGSMFEDQNDNCIETVQQRIDEGQPHWRVKTALSEGFLQERMICMNYKVLRGIYRQRKGHRLPHWRMFLEQVLGGIKYPDYISEKCK